MIKESICHAVHFAYVLNIEVAQIMDINRSWVMLGWLLTAQIMVAFIGRGLSPLGPLLEDDFSLAKWQVGLFPAALFFGQLLASIPAGYLTDRFGSRLMLLLICLLSSSAFILVSLTNVFWPVLLLIVIGGLGYGSMHPTTNRGIMYWFELRRRGTAMGIKQMGVTAGSMLAVLILLPMSIEYGWRQAMFVSSVVLTFIGIMAYVFYRDTAGSTKDVQEDHSFWQSMKKYSRHKALLAVSFAALGLNGAQMSFNTYIVFYAYESLMLGLILAGSFLVFSEAAGSFGRVAWGMISDFLFGGNRIIVLMAIAVLSFSCSMTLAFLPSETSLFWVIPLVILFGFSTAGFNGIWMNLATEIVPRKDAGVASGFSLLIGSLGVVVFPPIFGLLVDASGDYTLSWLFLGLIMILVIGLLAVAQMQMRRSP